MGKFVLDVKEWRMDCLMFYTKWDSLRKKCVVTDCKLEKHKLPLIDHKLSKTVESGDSPDSRDSVDSVFATPAEWKLERYALKLLWCFALKFGYGL
jgi:hypothetical protein